MIWLSVTTDIAGINLENHRICTLSNDLCYAAINPDKQEAKLHGGYVQPVNSFVQISKNE